MSQAASPITGSGSGGMGCAPEHICVYPTGAEKTGGGGWSLKDIPKKWKKAWGQSDQVDDHPRNNKRGTWATSWSHILEKFFLNYLTSS